jgi:cation transport protein ChaC
MRKELRLLWRREMLTGAYQARWVTARADSAAFRAITFVANRSHTRYTTGLPIERMAELINTGSGLLGTCREYFDSTLRAIEVLGIKDAGMERLRAAVAVQPRD